MERTFLIREKRQGLMKLGPYECGQETRVEMQRHGLCLTKHQIKF